MASQPSTTARPRHYLPYPQEVRRLFSVIKNKRDRAMVAVAYRHGLRASEIGMLQRTGVDLAQGRITINRLGGIALDSSKVFYRSSSWRLYLEDTS